MADVEDFLMFRGSSDQEAEEFVRAVRIQAFKSGKHDDPKWICAFAATALAGNALRWYLRLPASTQQDWLQFQDAILDHRWGDRTAGTSNMVPGTEPVPAAAPPPGSHPSSGPNMSPRHPQTQRTGRIRIIADRSIDGYIGKTFSEDGLSIVSDKTSAARIVYDPSEFPCVLKSSDFGPSLAFLGGQHVDSSEECCKFGPGATGHLAVGPSSDPSKANSRGPIYDNFTGDLFSKIWVVCEDLSLFAIAPQADCLYKLTPVALRTGESIILILVSNSATVRIMLEKDENTIAGARLYIEHEE